MPAEAASVFEFCKLRLKSDVMNSSQELLFVVVASGPAYVCVTHTHGGLKWLGELNTPFPVFQYSATRKEWKNKKKTTTTTAYCPHRPPPTAL